MSQFDSPAGSAPGSKSSSQAPSTQDYWRKCTTCKKPIGFGRKYWICSVSTCNRVRTDLVFCDLKCFDAHVPVLNHRDAGAFEKIAPKHAAVAPASQIGAKPQGPASVSSQSSAISSPQTHTSPDPDEILVVVSKVKAYVRARSGMNTSDSVMELLSHQMRKWADLAIESADQNGRKTVLDRDVK